MSQHSKMAVVKFFCLLLGWARFHYCTWCLVGFLLSPPPPRVNNCPFDFHLLSCPTLCIVTNPFPMVTMPRYTLSAAREFFGGSHHTHGWDCVTPAQHQANSILFSMFQFRTSFRSISVSTLIHRIHFRWLDSGLDAHCPREFCHLPSVLDNLFPRSHEFPCLLSLLFSLGRTYLSWKGCAFDTFYGFAYGELKKKNEIFSFSTILSLLLIDRLAQYRTWPRVTRWHHGRCHTGRHHGWCHTAFMLLSH